MRLGKMIGKLIFGGCFLLPLLAYAYLGTYNRLMSDDYCSAAYAKVAGVLGGAVVLYFGYTGRFTAGLLGTFIGSLGASAPPLIPALVLTAWLGVLVAALYQFKLAANRLARLYAALLLSTVILSTTLIISPRVSQSIIWEQAMSSYVPPLILAAAYAGLVQFYLRQPASNRKTYRYLLGFGLALIAGGFNETYVLLQTSIFALLILVDILASLPDAPRKTLPWYLAGFIGSFIAFIILFVAPGNLNRQSQFSPPPGLAGLLKISLTSWLSFGWRSLTTPMMILGLIGLVGTSILAGASLFFDSLSKISSGRAARQLLTWLPVGTALLLWVSFIPAAYGESGPPPDRDLITPYFLLVCAVAAWGYLAGQLLRQAYPGATAIHSQHLRPLILVCCLCFFVLSPAWAAYQVMQRQPSISRFAAQWDTANQMILTARSHGLTQVTVPHIDNWEGIEDLSPDPNFWVNRCAKVYYGITIQTE